jgi:hypothetical protein
MTDWNTRLAIVYQPLDPITGSPQGQPLQITPIDSFQSTLNTAAQALHSLEQTHVGAVFSPADLQFTMTVKQSASEMGHLTELGLNRQRFNIGVQVSEVNPVTGVSDWNLQSILLSNCIITTMQVGPFTTTPGAVPTILISGVSLHVQVTAADNSTAEAGSLA